MWTAKISGNSVNDDTLTCKNISLCDKKDMGNVPLHGICALAR